MIKHGTDTQSSPAQKKWFQQPVSRRSFLKGVGAATLVGLVEPTQNKLSQVAQFISGSTLEVQQRLLAQQSPLLNQALSELRQQGFPFDSSQSSILMHPHDPTIIGVVLQDIRVGASSRGADIALTLNTQHPEHSTLMYLIGEATSTGITVNRVVITGTGERTTALWRIARSAGSTVACAAAHANAATSARSSIAAGVPQTHSTRWYYDHCSSPRWERVRSRQGQQRVQLRFAECAEYRSYRSCTSTNVFTEWLGQATRFQLPA